MLQIVRQFTWRDLQFSLKTFAAAMLALYIAFRLNLSQPSWCVTTVYVVSQPFAGMVLAKSIYRVLGTVIGAVASLMFVALFANSPELFCLALALWIGAGTAVSIYLRDAPHAYVGMLAGYSAAIIGLPAALAPDSAFDFAIARCLEIMLGIVCGTLMHHLVLPQRAGDALRKALDATLPNMARWADDALRGKESDASGLADRRQIISAVVALDALRTFASLDTPAIKAVDAVVRQFEGKLLSLLALLVSVYDRAALLRRDSPATAAALQPLLDRSALHIVGSADPTAASPAGHPTADGVALLAEMDARLPPQPALRRDPDALLLRSILLRLRDVVAMWDEAVWMRSHIAAGTRPAEAAAPAFRPYRDLMVTLVGGAISTVTVLIASAFWVLTAWSSGATAVTFAGIMCAIMGARDNPVAAAAGFLKMSLAGAVIAGLYLFLILPTLSTFPALAIALAPFYLMCGLLLTAPAAIAVAMPLIFAAGGLMGISNAMDYDFAAFANNVVGYVVGIGIGAAALGLLRPLGTDWAVQRLTRGVMADLARMAGPGQPDSRSAFESRMFDRINALLMRLDPMIAEQRAAMQGALASLRVGLNILALKSYRPSLPPDVARPIDDALAALARHFARAMRDTPAVLPLPVLTAARDGILARDADDLLTRTADALYSIEITLAQHADFFGMPARPPSMQSQQSVTA